MNVLLGAYSVGDGEVAVALHGHRRATLDRFLDARLVMARERPEELARVVEAECLRGMAEVNRGSGAEHKKKTGRPAGGGTLTRGS